MINRIKELRTYLGLSLAAFGEMIGYTPTHVSRLEKGETSEAIVSLICSSFQVDQRYFTDPQLNVSEAVSIKQTKTGERLKQEREIRNWTQKELAKAVGVAQPVISKLEGGATVTEKFGRRLAEALEVGYDWLMEGDFSRREFPADEKLINWLWENPDIRKELWQRMKNDHNR